MKRSNDWKHTRYTEVGIPEVDRSGRIVYTFYCEEGFVETFIEKGDSTREELARQFRQYRNNDSFPRRNVHHPGMGFTPEAKARLKCYECEKVFYKKLKPGTSEIECPKCHGVDVEIN